MPKDAFRYRNVQIVAPGANEVIWNVQGNIPVTLILNPALQRNHQLLLILDGAQVEEYASPALRHTLTEVARGTHKLQVKVARADGSIANTSATVTFEVKQNSILNPNNPNNVNPSNPIARPSIGGP